MKTKAKLPVTPHLLKHAQHPILRFLGECLLCGIAFFIGIGIYSLSTMLVIDDIRHSVADQPTAEETIVTSCPVTFETQSTKIYAEPNQKWFFDPSASLPNHGIRYPSGKFYKQTSPECDVLKSRCGAFGFEDNDCDSYCGRGDNNTYIESQYVCGDLYLEKDIMIGDKKYNQGERYPYGVLLWGDCDDTDASYKANRSTMTTCGQGGVWNCTNGLWTCKGDTSGNNGGSNGGTPGNATLEGNVSTRDGASVNQVKINYYTNTNGNTIKNTSTTPDGNYTATDMLQYETYIIRPEKRDGIHSDFVKINDILLIEKYLNGTRQLSEEEMLAADVNDDKKIDQTDVQLMRDITLGKISHFPVQNIWRFTLKNSNVPYTFNATTRRRTFKGTIAKNEIDFTAIKLGDVDGKGSNFDDGGDDGSNDLKGGGTNGGGQQQLPPKGTLPPEEYLPPEQEPIMEPTPAPIEEQPIQEPIDNTPPEMDILPIDEVPVQEPIEAPQPGYMVPDLQVIDDTVDTTPRYEYQPTQPAYQPVTIPYVYTPAAFDRSAWFTTPSAITITPTVNYNSYGNSAVTAPTQAPQPTQVYTAPSSANGTIYYFGN